MNHTVFLFPNGNMVVYGPEGQQLPKLCKPWILMVKEHLLRAGIDPASTEIVMPGGIEVRFTRDGKNWNVSHSPKTHRGIGQQDSPRKGKDGL